MTEMTIPEIELAIEEAEGEALRLKRLLQKAAERKVGIWPGCIVEKKGERFEVADVECWGDTAAIYAHPQKQGGGFMQRRKWLGTEGWTVVEKVEQEA